MNVLSICEVHLEKFIEGLQNKVNSGKYEEAESLVANFKRPGSHNVAGISITSDIDAYEKAFSDASLEPLFTFEGHLSKITPPLFRGISLLSFQLLKRVSLLHYNM